jgi:hypothetical protein
MEAIHLFENLEFEEKFQKYNENLNGQKNELLSCERVQKYSNSLKVVEMFDAFAGSLKVVDTKLSELEATEYGYVLLEIDIPNSNVSTSFFPNNEPQNAEVAYISSEKKAAGNDGMVVALVSTSAVGDIKEAYPNYFADSTAFLNHLVLIQTIPGTRKKKLLEKMFSLNTIGDLRY